MWNSSATTKERRRAETKNPSSYRRRRLSSSSTDEEEDEEACELPGAKVATGSESDWYHTSRYLSTRPAGGCHVSVRLVASTSGVRRATGFGSATNARSFHQPDSIGSSTNQVHPRIISSPNCGPRLAEKRPATNREPISSLNTNFKTSPVGWFHIYFLMHNSNNSTTS